MLQAMIDVEALRLKQPWLAPLMQVGVAIFDEKAHLVATYEFYVDQDKLPPWAKPEVATMGWWADQPFWDKLQGLMAKHGESPHNVMMKLGECLRAHKVGPVWFAGPQYDQVMLEAYYDEYGINYPWKFNDVRDFRTIRKQHPEIERTSEAGHDAVQDAIDQVLHLFRIGEAKGLTWS